MNWYTGSTTYDTVLAIALAIAVLVIIGACLKGSPRPIRFHGAWVESQPEAGLVVDGNPGNRGVRDLLPHRAAQIRHHTVGARGHLAAALQQPGLVLPAVDQTDAGETRQLQHSVLIAGMAITSLHGCLNGSFFSHDYRRQYGTEWLRSPVSAGLIVYLGIHSAGLVGVDRAEPAWNNPGAAEQDPVLAASRFITSPAYLGES